MRGGQSGDEVGRARTGGRDTYADAITGTRIPVGGVRSRLLVANQDVPQSLVLMERVIEGHDGTARIAEHHFHARINQRTRQDLSARQELGHGLHSPEVAAAQCHGLETIGVIGFVQRMHQGARTRLDDVR